MKPATLLLRICRKVFQNTWGGKVKGMIEELKKENVLLLKKTGYGMQVSINLDKQEKVMEYIDEFLKKR